MGDYDAHRVVFVDHIIVISHEAGQLVKNDIIRHSTRTLSGTVSDVLIIIH